MSFKYQVKAFVPNVKGCGAQDQGWDSTRCQQFADFLNENSKDGWRFHSSEYREVKVKGCGGGNGAWLVCTFEKSE